MLIIFTASVKIVFIITICHTIIMDFEEKKYWVGFSCCEGIGPQRFALLRSYFGSAQAAFWASRRQLVATGLRPELIDFLVTFRKKFNFDSYFLRLKRLKITVITSEEENYPVMLKEITGPPFVLYVKTDQIGLIGQIFSLKAIAIVGTRTMTAYGREVTEKFTRALVKRGFVIVSGLARGVDRVAHETALAAGGKTIAVCGTSLETVYPSEHWPLAEKIAASGALISEYPLRAKIKRANFAIRDRLISGLSRGVLVTEAAEGSGTMITAGFAAEQGRDVFAVPGPVTSPLSAGTAMLIKKGAKLVYNIEDILEEIKLN